MITKMQFIKSFRDNPSASKMAEFHGVHNTTIYKWAKKFDLPVKPDHVDEPTLHWGDLKDPTARVEALDDCYFPVGSADTHSEMRTEAIVISIGFAKLIAAKNPDVGAILKELGVA